MTAPAGQMLWLQRLTALEAERDQAKAVYDAVYARWLAAERAESLRFVAVWAPGRSRVAHAVPRRRWWVTDDTWAMCHLPTEGFERVDLTESGARLCRACKRWVLRTGGDVE